MSVFEEDFGFECEGGSVGEDATLGVEEEGIAAFACGERGDVVRGHGVEPADAIGTGDAEPAEIFDGGERGGLEEGLESHCGGGWCVHLDYMGVRWVGLAVVWGLVGAVGQGTAYMPPQASPGVGPKGVAVVRDAGPSAARRDARRFAQDDGAFAGSGDALRAAQDDSFVGEEGSKETVITPQQAKVLLESVDQIMGFVAADTGLAPVVKVKRRLVTRAEVNQYLMKSFAEDESAKRLQRSEIVLKKFGLLDRDFDLKPFLLSLLTEQIAGYYDDKTKTVNLLNWVDPEEQKPVLAHELTHAVQDKQVNLEKWSSDGLKGVSRTAAEDAGRLADDEKETARQAVTEGQAMVVFIDYGLPKGTTLADQPELAARMKAGAESGEGAGDSPVMKRAPLLLQRSLLFPYADGLTFETTLLLKGGKAAAFAGVLARPPGSSFEVMHPDAYLRHAPVPQVRLPDVHAELDTDWEPYDIGVMGELDVEIMGSLFGGKEIGKKLAPQWDGGAYYAAQRRSATAEEKTKPGSLGVFYFSRWKTEAAAREFEAVYGRSVGRKYSGVVASTQSAGEGEEVFSTNEGDVLMVLRGKDLFISEGFPLKEARRLGEEIEAVQGTGPMRMAAGPELGLGWVGRWGMMGLR